jgi:trans-aconitate 2-methyltransferase
VVDLGCGPGNLTSLLRSRWPGAELRGLDSSPEMIDRARAADPIDVLVSNATLQWVSGHLDLLPALASRVRAGGWLAFQVPGNFDEPSHTIRTELAAEAPYDVHTQGVAVPSSHDPVVYLEALTALGCRVDAWETTYLHVLTGADAVFTWVSGTGARPTLQALPDDLRPGFEDEFRRRLRAAYPERDGRVVLPFRRIFVVAEVPADSADRP